MAFSKHTFRYALQQLFDPTAVGPFILGGLALGVFSNSISELAAEVVGRTPFRIFLIAAGSLTVLLFCAVLVAVKLSRFASRHLETQTQKPEPRRGLVFLVSQLDPAGKAIQYHMPTLEKV